jgi:transmembrane sensor
MNYNDDFLSEGVENTRRAKAADWVALNDAGLSAEQQDEFFDWLATDPKNSEVYTELTQVYRDLDIMVEWRPIHALEPNPDLLADQSKSPRQKQWWFAALGGMAAMLALALFVSRGDIASDSGVSPIAMLAAGDVAQSYQRHVLEDGSVVELNRGAQVSVQFESTRRVLELLAGEAHFTVAKDPQRPFVVQADTVAVTAIGTEFNISLQDDQLEVIVTEGRIRLEPSIILSAEDGVTEIPTLPVAQTLDAGQGFMLTSDSPGDPWEVADYSGLLVVKKLAWKNELVDFSGVSLAEVILEFNQRHQAQLIMGDAGLADRTITGTLRLSNLEGFVELLSITQNIEAERHGRSKIVLRERR